MLPTELRFENGLPNLPVSLIEPHRNREGVWRIKFCYETDQPLSMSAVQASAMAIHLHHIGEVQLAGEIDDAVRSATRYASCLLYTSPSPRDGLLSRMP